MEETRREFISKLEKGTAGGVASLDANGQLPVSQMPTNSQIYAGEWDASTGENPPTPSRSGIYYNISVEGTIDGEHYNVNDWIIYDGTKWNKQVQTADVSSVDGRKGAVDLTDKYAQLATENTFAEVNTFEKGLVSNQSINLKNNNINNASYVYTNNVQVPNDETTLYLGDENGANVTIGSYDDEYNTTTQIRGNTIRVYSDNPIEGITNIQERQFNDVNILSTIDNLANNANKNITYFCRFRGTCSNTPYGSGDCDFHATVHKIGGDNNWIFVELQDVRSEWGFNWVIAKVNGTWKNWMRNANTGDIPTNLSQLNNDIGALRGTWDGNVLRLYV